jgi:carboxymethylenebutenolidase
MSETVELIAADGARIPAYVARPAGKPRGALVVMQEIFGVNAHIRAVADGYAKDGYLAVAPHVFHRVQPGVDLGYGPQDIAAGAGHKQKTEALPAPGAQQDVQAAIDWAARTCGGKVAIVGYCWGGLLAWRAACGLQGLACAVTYYGGGMTTIPEEVARQPKIPVLSHFAERDQHILVPTVEAFKKQHPDIPVHLYAADHGFNCDLRGAWNPEAAKLARERTLAFLGKYVG